MKSLAKLLTLVMLMLSCPGLSFAQNTQSFSLTADIGSIMELPVMAFPSGDNNMHLLNDPSVIKDLELVDEQLEMISQLSKAHGKIMQKQMKQLSKAKGDPDRMKEFSSAFAEMQTSHAEELSNVLLPHQLKRIKQVAHQMKIKSMGSAGALQHGALGTELNLSDAQKKKFAEINQELQKEIAAKTAELKEAAKKKVMDELTAKQKTQLKEITGEEFKRDHNDWKTHLEKLQTDTKKKRQDKDKDR